MFRFSLGRMVDSECGPATELPLVEKLPVYFAWSALPRNEVVEDEKVFVPPAIDLLDSKFIKEYEKHFSKPVETVECRRTRNLLLTPKWISSIVESVFESMDPNEIGPQQVGMDRNLLIVLYM